MKKPLLGSFGPPVDSKKHMLGALQHIDLPMRRFKELDEVDYVIVGVGSPSAYATAILDAARSCLRKATWLRSCTFDSGEPS